MPFIPNPPEYICRDPEHNPPLYYDFPVEGGKWVCPSCGQETIISPNKLTMI